MKKIILFCCLIITAFSASSQKCEVEKLNDMLNWNGDRIDTTLKNLGYRLMKKDIDSSSSLYQYSFLGVDNKKPVTLRSLSYMDAQNGKFTSRLITYRTYDENEYQEITSYLLAHDYRSTGQYDFGEAKHTVYSNGKQSIRLKVITTALEKDKKFVTYELELGK
jgi:hypothetical protein